MLRRNCLAVTSVKERGQQSKTTVIAEEKLHGCGSCIGEVLAEMAYGTVVVKKKLPCCCPYVGEEPASWV
jgi:hypothetical protein